MKKISIYLLLFMSGLALFGDRDFFNTVHKKYRDQKYREVVKLCGSDTMNKLKNNSDRIMLQFMNISSLYQSGNYIQSFQEAVHFMKKKPTSRESGDVIIVMRNSLEKISDLRKIDKTIFKGFKSTGLKKIIRKKLVAELAERNDVDVMEFFSDVFSLDQVILNATSFNQKLVSAGKSIKEKKYNVSSKLIAELKKAGKKGAYFNAYLSYLEAVSQDGLGHSEKSTALYREIILKYPHSKFVIPALSRLKNSLSYNKLLNIIEEAQKKTGKHLKQHLGIAFFKGHLMIQNNEFEKAGQFFESLLSKKELKDSKTLKNEVIRIQATLLIVYKKLKKTDKLNALKTRLEKYESDFPYLKKILKIY